MRNYYLHIALYLVGGDLSGLAMHDLSSMSVHRVTGLYLISIYYNGDDIMSWRIRWHEYMAISYEMGSNRENHTCHTYPLKINNIYHYRDNVVYITILPYHVISTMLGTDWSIQDCPTEWMWFNWNAVCWLAQRQQKRNTYPWENIPDARLIYVLFFFIFRENQNKQIDQLKLGGSYTKCCDIAIFVFSSSRAFIYIW